MKIGIPMEIKNNENRVSLTPAGVSELLKHHHSVFVETNAGVGSSIPDQEYIDAGATIVQTAAEAWACDMVLKVKEPLPEEFDFLREDLLLFTYLHLAANKPLTEVLITSKTTAIAYESVETDDHRLPLLTPMSEVAGRMAVQIGAQFLQKTNGGKGILLGGVPGVSKANVVIVGGGVAGVHAAEMALGLGANVTILDVNVNRLRTIDTQFNGKIQTLVSSRHTLTQIIPKADLLIGTVLIRAGAR